MNNVLISTRTKAWIVGRQYFPSDPVAGTVIVDTYAMISRNGREPREYKVSVHDGCSDNGFLFTTMEEWSNDVHCTGCDFYKYHSIGD